jgi:hypothetical protein
MLALVEVVVVVVVVVVMMMMLWQCFHQNVFFQCVDKRIDRLLVELPQVPSDCTASPLSPVLRLLVLAVVEVSRRMVVQALSKRDQEALCSRGGHGRMQGVGRGSCFVRCCCCWSLTMMQDWRLTKHPIYGHALLRDDQDLHRRIGICT